MSDTTRESQAPAPKRARQRRATETESLLLEVAVDVLATVGYAGATTTRVQTEAKVSRGRMLHHFASRDELLLAATRHLVEKRMHALQIAAELPDDLGERIDHGIRAMWDTYSHPFFWASSELWLASRHNAVLKASLAPEERRLGALVRATVTEIFGVQLAAGPLWPEVRDLLNTSMRGTAMTYAFTDRNPREEPMIALWEGYARRTLLGRAAGGEEE